MRLPLDWESLTFAHLTTLELSFIRSSNHYTLNQLRRILAASPRLEHITLRQAIPSAQGESPVHFLTIRSLKSLFLRDFNSVSELERCVNLIRAPNLETLMLRDFTQGDYGSAMISLGGVPGKGGYNTVKKLRMGGINLYSLNQQGLAGDFLSLFPHVTHLILDKDIQDYYLTVLDMERIEDGIENVIPPFPSLRTLQTTSFDAVSFLKFLKRRKDYGHPLNTVLLPRHSVWESKVSIIQSLITGQVEFFVLPVTRLVEYHLEDVYDDFDRDYDSD